MDVWGKLAEIGENALDIVDATTESFGSNIRANYTADAARADAIAASVEIAAQKARGDERRKDELVKILKTVLISLLGAGFLTIILTYAIKMKK